ncbi:MAG: hypothetical protein ACTSYR_00810 [Candidatus Odinarchaeia archaeon]
MSLKKEFESILNNFKENFSKLEEFKSLIDSEMSKLKKKINSLEKRAEQIKEKDSQILKLKEENDKLNSELKAIQEQLNNISKLYKELSKERKEELNVKELLSIYVVLLEEVFDARPHAKILYLLHGGKNKISREALTKATGFQPAVVLHSLHDLNNAGLLEFDYENDFVTLKKRIYE